MITDTVVDFRFITVCIVNLNNDMITHIMRIMVTGGAGFIGSHLSSALIELGHSVVILDNFDPYYPVMLKEYNLSLLQHKGLQNCIRADVCDFDALSQAVSTHQPEIIFHLAAKAGVRNSVEHPLEYLQTNILGTQHILQAASKYDVRKVCIASSSSVYGSNTKVPFKESDRVENQVSPYAASKRAMEVICKTYHQVYGLPLQLFRFFTVYGPSGRPDMAPVLFTRAIDQGKPISVFGSTQTQRDYTYVDDVVAGLVAAIDVQDSFEIYNIGNNQPSSLETFISTLSALLGKEAILNLTPKRIGDVDQTWADLSKSKRRLGYQPKFSLEKGLQRFVQWYVEHKDLYEQI